MVVPAPVPVTAPVPLTVATPTDIVLHTPPDGVLLHIVVSPTQMVEVPVIALGRAVAVTTVVT